KRQKCAPFTIGLLITIYSTLDLSTSLHVEVYVCLTTSFYAIIQIGELMVPLLLSFNPQCHVKVSNLHYDTDHHRYKVVIFHLPQTKTSLAGE
ncbi:hypothetical protein BD769DRAFT_1303974, partial [Suillus cothurnatus]